MEQGSTANQATVTKCPEATRGASGAKQRVDSENYYLSAGNVITEAPLPVSFITFFYFPCFFSNRLASVVCMRSDRYYAN